MLIDWFTVIAQIINFLILVWLLKRFLYRPLLNAIDAREKRIADKIAEAEDIEKKATDLREHFRKLNESFDAHYDEKIKSAEEDAQKKRETMIKKTHQDIETIKKNQKQALNEEIKKLQNLAEENLKKEFFESLQQALNDLADTSLETQIVSRFIQLLDNGEVSKKQKHLIKTTSTKNVMIKSTFGLSNDQKKQIQRTIDTLFNRKIKIEYQLSKKLICGINLIIDDEEVSWSIDRYIDVLEKTLNEQLSHEE